MRLAFVVRLGSNSRPAEGLFEGWVEEVDSCMELRFRSTSQLLEFLGQRFEVVTASAANAARVTRNIQTGKKVIRKKKPAE